MAKAQYYVSFRDDETDQIYNQLVDIAPEGEGMDGILGVAKDALRSAAAQVSAKNPLEDGGHLLDTPGRLVPRGIFKMGPTRRFDVLLELPKGNGRKKATVQAVDRQDAEFIAVWNATVERLDDRNDSIDILSDWDSFEDALIDINVVEPKSEPEPLADAFVSLYNAAVTGEGLDEAVEAAREVLVANDLIEDAPSGPKL
jgi:hypothetical protein